MKSIILFISFLFVFNTYSQWNLIYPSLTDNPVHNVVTNNDEDWLTCANGLLMKRDRNGTYKKYDLETMSDITGIFFLSNEVSWAYGTDGLLVTTNDRWETFRKISLEYGHDVVAFTALDEITWYIIVTTNNRTFDQNSYIMKTTDKGVSWTILKSEWGKTYNATIRFFNSSKGYANFRDGLLKTTDGGASWININPSGYSVSQVYFTSESSGWCIGYGFLLYTGNGGANWNRANPLYEGETDSFIIEGDSIKTVQFRSWPNYGDIYRIYSKPLIDGNWSYKDLTHTDDWGIFTFSGFNNYYLISPGQSSFQKYSEVDHSWVLENKNGFFYIIFISPTKWWGIGEEFYETTDSGNHWEKKGNFYGSFYFLDKDTLFLFYGEEIFKSTDGGLTYHSVYHHEASPEGYGVNYFFTDKSNGYVLYYNYEYTYISLIVTSDGGDHWSQRLYMESERPSNFIYNNGKMFIQYNDKGLASKDLGFTWYESTAIGTSIIFIDGLNGWLTYNDNVAAYVKKTTDGGDTFNTIFQDYSMKDLSSVLFLDTLRGYISGDAGTYYSSDGGYTWNHSAYIKFTKLIKSDFNKVFGISEYYGFYIFDSLSVVSVLDSKNKNEVWTYSLSQNYPNPFNPSTTIKYNVPSAGNVTIKVFNALGQEIKTLLNENRSTGDYEINFDASDFPSGVYFYRLQAGSFIETKKMILIR